MTTLTKSPSRPVRSSISRLNPFDRFFRNDFLDFWNDYVPETIPSINIKEEKDNYKIEMAAPGLKKDDFNINIEGNLLTVSCEKESEIKEGKESDNFSRREYNYTSFSRTLSLPENTDINRIQARYNDGILLLNIAKKTNGQLNKSQKIRVE